MSRSNSTPTFKTPEQKYRLLEPYMQNRELSWLTFDKRVLDQGAEETVPLLERLNFVSIFWSNLQEFFMVRVGSLTDLSYLKTPVVDSKSGLTAKEQIHAIHDRCHELYPLQQEIFEDIRAEMAEGGIHHLHVKEMTPEQRAYIAKYAEVNIVPFLAPQIVNSRHPFPHLENGALYVIVRLDEFADKDADAGVDKKKKKKKSKQGGAEGVTLGIIPMPHQCHRVVEVPGDEESFVLLEEVIQYIVPTIFDMYKVKHTNIICVTRNADLDTSENDDEVEMDYREYMKRMLRKRGRLEPVRLESNEELSPVVKKTLLDRLGLEEYQTYVTSVPLDLSYTWGLGSLLPQDKRAPLVNSSFNPAISARIKPNKPILKQVLKHDLMLCYPYETMDTFVQLLEEAAVDPAVVSIRITLYRLASSSRLAEALIRAAENGKDVTALFELRARFDEDNNIRWSQRFEESGCNVIYGFRDYKVHSKICSITRQTDDGLQFITQFGTGNYNEKTARLYTDVSYITTRTDFGVDAVNFFQNMALENASDEYKTIWVAPLQIKPNIMAGIDAEMAKARAGKPCGLFFKTNSITDKEVIEKLVEASQAGVPVTLFVRGISCIVPGVKGYTDNIRVVSIVGRLLEHSRIYCFGAKDDPEMRMYCSSADLMTRNMDNRVEIAWPITDEKDRARLKNYLFACMKDTAKLRELQPDGAYTPLGYFGEHDADGNIIKYTLGDHGERTGLALFESQQFLIDLARMSASEQEAAYAELRGLSAEEGTATVEQDAEQGEEASKPVDPVVKAESAVAAAAVDAVATMAAARADVETARAAVEPRVAEALESVEPAVEEARAAMGSAVEDMQAAIGARVAEVRAAVEPKVAEVRSAVEPRVAEARAAVEPHVAAVREAVAPKVAAAKATVDPRVSEEHEMADPKVEEIRAEAERRIAEAERVAAEAKAEAERKVAEARAEAERRVAEMRAAQPKAEVVAAKTYPTQSKTNPAVAALGAVFRTIGSIGNRLGRK